ncbi:hypothetical protein MBLNU230_g3189t1 [Neophaeotheca triangularis]
MADEFEVDYGYDDDFYDWDDDYIYVEDPYSIADELAESQIPDPGYSGVNDEIAMETFDFDPYDYHMDTEYGGDSYWDSNMHHLASMREEKRKRVWEQQQQQQVGRVNGKERQEMETGIPNVVFRSLGERLRRALYAEEAAQAERGKGFALLPDWRQRFKGVEAPAAVKEMPAEMRKAALADGEESPPHKETKRKSKTKAVAVKRVEEEDEWEDDDDEAMGDVEEGGAEGGIALDPEMLKAVLKQRLGEAGLDGLDEATFMQSITKMLSGEGGGADGAAGELAQTLLGKAGDDQALSGWLSGQGVSLGASDEGDEESLIDDEPASGGKQNVADKGTPVDIAAASSSTKAPIAVRKLSAVVIRVASAQSPSKKRPASAIAGDNGKAKKRKTVTFDDGERETDGSAGEGTGESVRDETTANATEVEPSQAEETSESKPMQDPKATKATASTPASVSATSKPTSAATTITRATKTTRAHPGPKTTDPQTRTKQNISSNTILKLSANSEIATSARSKPPPAEPIATQASNNKRKRGGPDDEPETEISASAPPNKKFVTSSSSGRNKTVETTRAKKDGVEKAEATNEEADGPRATMATRNSAARGGGTKGGSGSSASSGSGSVGGAKGRDSVKGKGKDTGKPAWR